MANYGRYRDYNIMVKKSQKEKELITMSLLRSYSFGHVYGVSELPDDVLNLFVSLANNPSKKIEHASEIISAGLQNNINFNKEFNIDAYEATIRKNERLGKENKRKKEVFIDYSDAADDWEETSKSGGIKADIASVRNAMRMQDAYEDLIQEDTLRYAVDTIKSLRQELLIEAKIDIIKTIQQALKCIPESVQALKDVCRDYSIVAEQVEVVLSSGLEFDVLFA